LKQRCEADGASSTRLRPSTHERKQTRPDAAEAEVDSVGALDLIRHALPPTTAVPPDSAQRHSASSWKTLDDSAHELDSYVEPRRLSVGGKQFIQTHNAPSW